MKRVRVMRGLPGSGKSTRARKAQQEAEKQGQTAVICSADDFFITRDGSYVFKPARLGEAHHQCLVKFIEALFAGIDLVIVDNTNIRVPEFILYMKLAKIAGRMIEIDGAKHISVAEITMWHARCVHDVPMETMKKRAEQWEDVPTSWEVVHV